MRREPLEVNAGPWWRFDRYEVRGDYLRPAVDARLETYDPWESYVSARDTRGQPPHHALLQLLAEQPRGRTVRTDARLAAWAAEHGLLGILVHHAVVAVLPPKWEPVGLPFASRWSGGVAPTQRAGGPLAPRLRRHVRTGAVWITREESAPGEVTPLLSDAPDRAGQRVEDAEVPLHWSPPGVLLRDPTTSEWSVEPISQGWARFFPDVPANERETFPYPVPMTEAFWRLYAEPVDEFLATAARLAEALKYLREMAPFDRASENHILTVRHGRGLLQGLVEPVNPGLALIEDGTFRLQWRSPSLLGSLAMMALQDLAEKRRVHLCETCGAPFLSGARGVRYCSETHRYRAQKQAQRRNRRDRGEEK